MITRVSMREVSASELKQMMDSNVDFQLIDLREEHELHECTLNGTHIPMGEVIEKINLIRRDVPVIMHCRSGKRAAAVIYALEAKFNLTNLCNLRGGILAWAEEIDPQIMKH